METYRYGWSGCSVTWYTNWAYLGSSHVRCYFNSVSHRYYEL